MPKQKFNSVDVAAEVAELRRLVVGSWLANIYDLDDKKTFLLKFTKSGGRTESGEGEKIVVLLESGARFHSTSYARERKADAPGKLNAKLRMHLRGKRLNDVRQLGRDRAVEFVFGANDTKHALVLELYARGNLVLLDKNDTILTLLRPVRDDDAGLVMLGNRPYDRRRFRGGAGVASVRDVEAALETGTTGVGFREDESRPVGDGPDPTDTETASVASVSRSRTSAPPPRTLREALCRAFGFSPQIADRVASRAGAPNGGLTRLPLRFDADATDAADANEDETRETDDASTARRAALIENVAKELRDLEAWLEGVADGSIAPEGHAEETFLPEHVDGDVAPHAADHADHARGRWVPESFSPFPFPPGGGASLGEAPRSRARVEPRGFDALVDEHFASIERAADLRARARASRSADKKADKVRRDQERRAADLRREEAREATRATLIEYNLDAVDAALAAVNAFLASGQSWDEIERVVDEERRAGNPVAGLIRSLDLANGAVTVGLTNRLDAGSDESSDDDARAEKKETCVASTSPPRGDDGRRRRKKESVAVTLDLSLSAYANAREHFERKKKHAAKFEKTVARSGDAIESANRDVEAKRREAAKRKNVGVGAVSLARTPEWFEKFHWFVTPENCLVLSARDASQTDLLVKKYMGPHDAFVRADVPRAPATVVKAPRRLLEAPPDATGKSACLVPPISLAHAGTACLCRSAAWDTRTVISAWWVPAGDVRKTAPNGDPLAPGVVWHVGEKRYLPPAPLVMGYAYAFLVAGEADAARHAEDRAVRVAFEPHDASAGESRPREDPRAAEDGEHDDRTAKDPNAASKKSALDAFLDGSVETASSGPTVVLGSDAEDGREDDREDEPNRVTKTEPPAPPRAGKARVSAAERRAMKKRARGAAKDVASGDGGDGDALGPSDKPSKETPKTRPAAPSGLGGASSVDASRAEHERAKTKPLPRGKSAKARRAAAKYAEQDEEDRALAMALLGVKIDEKPETRRGGGRPAEASADTDTVTEKAAVDVSSAADITERDAETYADDGATPAEATATAKGGGIVAAAADDDDAAATAAADEAEDDDDDARVSFAERNLARVERVDWFTGAPFLETEVTHAVALVAPWDALKAFAYKAKLTPGSQKKGKAAKQALEVATRAPPAVDVARSKEAPVTLDVTNVSADRTTDHRGGSKPETRREKAARAARDSSLKAMIAAAAAAAAAGDGAMLMCGQGVKVSMPAGAAKAMNASKKGGKRGS